MGGTAAWPQAPRCARGDKQEGIGTPLAILLGMLLLTACGGVDSVSRPELHLGVDECSFCRMILSEDRHAAVARDATGAELRFDDLGCMAAHHSLHANSQPWTVWVHTQDGGWLPGERIWVARVPSQRTPMGSGLAAFSSHDLAARAGQDVVDLEGLFARTP